MSNNIEKAIKILESYLEQQDRKFISEYRLEFIQAIENILADRERLQKEKNIHIKLEQQYKKDYLDMKNKYDSLVEKIKKERRRKYNE